MRDRFFDLHVNVRMQKIVTDRIRPQGKNDPYGVDQAMNQLRVALDMVDRSMEGSTWAIGDTFTMADCAAAPALAFANRVMPFADSHKNAARYLARLMQRPSFARADKEAEPYIKNFPR
jgi:glutathione S-transferase